jgi:hypothetical protein
MFRTDIPGKAYWVVLPISDMSRTWVKACSDNHCEKSRVNNEGMHLNNPGVSGYNELTVAAVNELRGIFRLLPHRSDIHRSIRLTLT